jgi:hypothetical protein
MIEDWDKIEQALADYDNEAISEHEFIDIIRAILYPEP